MKKMQKKIIIKYNSKKNNNNQQSNRKSSIQEQVEHLEYCKNVLLNLTELVLTTAKQVGQKLTKQKKI